MSKIGNEIKNLLEEVPIWVLATADKNGVPNAVPIRYTKVLGDDRLMLVDNYMKKTLLNLRENRNVAISVWKRNKSMGTIGYQFKGIGTIETRGAYFDEGKQLVKRVNPKLNPKGVVLVKVDSIYLLNPGPNAGSKIG
jgi:predicted pyridoxine 5'-phosphate oxidase superfamily flavin-nucleotide-binding protein